MAESISKGARRPGFLPRAFSTPEPAGTLDRRDTWITLACATALGAWLFAYKLDCYLSLTYTSDLFQFAQLGTTWLDGRFLMDNCYGNHLSSHTYFFVPLLALLVVPFGVPGLLLALALALGAGFVAIVRILRLFAVPLAVAIPVALMVSAMPLSVHVYQDVIYGFHVDLLLPAMALWLGYFLLRRNWPGAILMALVLVSVKEEASLLVAAVGAAVFLEDIIRGSKKSVGPDSLRWPSLNRPAVVAVLLAQRLSTRPRLAGAPGLVPGSLDRGDGRSSGDRRRGGRLATAPGPARRRGVHSQSPPRHQHNRPLEGRRRVRGLPRAESTGRPGGCIALSLPLHGLSEHVLDGSTGRPA